MDASASIIKPVRFSSLTKAIREKLFHFTNVPGQRSSSGIADVEGMLLAVINDEDDNASASATAPTRPRCVPAMLYQIAAETANSTDAARTAFWSAKEIQQRH